MNLNPKQKKLFYDIFTLNDISWNDFEEIQVELEGLPHDGINLIHKPTQLFFLFGYNSLSPTYGSGRWMVSFAPGQNNIPQTTIPSIISWDEVLRNFHIWVKMLKEQIEAHIFMEAVQQYKDSVNSYTLDFSMEEPFKPNEEAFIKEQLLLIQDKLKDLDPLKEQVEIINSRITYLINRLDKKFPKVDWLNIFVGTIMSTMATEGIDLAKDPTIMDSIKLLFHTLSGGKFLN